jgi:hypothetical protein
VPLPNEPEVLDARQCFADAQRSLEGVTEARIGAFHTCGWYGTEVNDERGSFALVDEAGPLADLIGDRLRIRYDRREVYVYCFGSTDLPVDVAITRRAFARLDLLAKDEINVIVEVVRE